ncbi:polysaccharide biosynthesis protein [Brachybacterium halotolerans subsp. kimchii]|uniref:polysaccharide biosynthesis protein n=1 Tax=Brachybacterium halotolerans TaxID=2795215 RepID=UPI001E3ABFF0|nr:nucleoside-diphosphate sugar epimerase/dehydratase [Brachybacterium halotolerans]UEJ81105.1 polysaccharide biosynthesis protein [Brachybacterium halotolerans subsp. kimchii]
MAGASEALEDAQDRGTTLWPRRFTQAGIERNTPWVVALVLGACDLVMWALGWLVADLLLPGVVIVPALVLALVSIAVQFIAGALLGVYRHRYIVGSVGELRTVALASAISAIAAALGSLAFAGDRFFGGVLLAWLAALVLMIGARQALRMAFDRERAPRDAQDVVIVGAGILGASLIDHLLSDKHSKYRPVALVDDDLAKRAMVVRGVPVRGRTMDLARVLDETGADGAIVAISEADSDLFSRLADQVDTSARWVRTVPTFSEMLTRDSIGRLVDLDVEDLVGRPITPPDTSAAREVIAGRRVLVTGAGGSIGSELCRQIKKLEPASLVMLDRDESALHALSMSLQGSALLDQPEYVLADIRDREALDAVFTEHRPEVVFHAAALKHLPMLERFPAEGWKTNVHGSRNVIDAAEQHGVERFVNVSTDKAARPTSILGASKRVAEGLTTDAADRTGRRYVSVRFGNVIGSRGSAIPAFGQQIRNGGPVTVTHKDVTRYFMTIPEACQLVLFALSVGRSGETLVLEMGEPVKIVDIARRMISLAGVSCEIVFTGLRPGEKLAEELFTPDENTVLTRSGRVWHVRNEPIAEGALPAPAAPETAIDAFYTQVLAENDLHQVVEGSPVVPPDAAAGTTAPAPEPAPAQVAPAQVAGAQVAAPETPATARTPQIAAATSADGPQEMTK